MELVRRKPERADAVREIRFLPRPVAGRYGDRIAECVRHARELPPTKDEHARLLEDAAVRARIDSMWLALQIRCMADDLAPNLLCSRSEFTDWCASRIALDRRRRRGEAAGEAPSPFSVADWRSTAIGGWLQDFVEGRGTLNIRWDSEAGAIRPVD